MGFVIKFHRPCPVVLAPFAKPTPLEAARERTHGVSCRFSSGAQEIDRVLLAAAFFQRDRELDSSRAIQLIFVWLEHVDGFPKFHCLDSQACAVPGTDLSNTAGKPVDHKLYSAVIPFVRTNDLQMIARDDGMRRLIERGEGRFVRDKFIVLSRNRSKLESRIRTKLRRPVLPELADESASLGHVAKLPLQTPEKTGFGQSTARRAKEDNVLDARPEIGVVQQ